MASEPKIPASRPSAAPTRLHEPDAAPAPPASAPPEWDGFAAPFHDERPTEPGTARAKARDTTPAREGWGFERDETTGKIASVSVMCLSCLRPTKISAPRFSVDEHGLVAERDQGLGFRCTVCDRPIGPLKLADWRFGKI